MRIGIVRTDIGRIYLDDVENTSQRDFSSEPAGQSRYFKHPTDAQLQAILTSFGIAPATLSVATLKLTLYPTATTLNVTAASLGALAGITGLASGPKSACCLAIADLAAPKLVETGMALLSFHAGKLSKMTSSTFRPGGTRGGLPAGVAAAIYVDDGTSVFSL